MGKYFKYAIGEILLVVIGILIALQINNWNEKQANEKEAYNQLLEVQKEILNNIAEFDRSGTYYFEKLRDVRRVFSDTLTLEDYQKSRTLRNIITSFSPVVTQNEAFNKLAENADNLPDKYKTLVTEIKTLYNHSRFERSRTTLGVLSNQYFDFTTEFRESNYRGDYDAYFKFLLTSKAYKNKLARFSWTLDDVAPEIVRKKYHAIKVYNQMIELGFPKMNNAIANMSIQKPKPEMVKPFVGKYTNKIDTINISYEDKKLTGYYSKYDFTNKLILKDSTTIIFYGRALEFNENKSEFYYLMDGRKPNFKRIPENGFI